MPKTAVTATVAFDVLVQRLYPIVEASASARRASTLVAFGKVTDITGGGSLTLTPTVSYGQATQPGDVATLRLNSAASASVPFACTSSNSTVLQDMTSLSVPSGSLVALPIPPPAGTLSKDTVVTYTCAPTSLASGLPASDTAKFDVLVLYHGILALAGASSVNSATILPVTAATNVGFSAPGPATLVPTLLSETASSSAVQLQAKTAAVAVDVNCMSSNAAILANFNVLSLTNAGVVAAIPASAPVTADTSVTYTCTVQASAPWRSALGLSAQLLMPTLTCSHYMLPTSLQMLSTRLLTAVTAHFPPISPPQCPVSPYTGTESVQFTVKVLARGILAAAGSSPGTAADGTSPLQPGQLLATGTLSATVRVMELSTTLPGTLASLYTTVPPTASVAVACASSNTAVLPDIPSILLGTGSSILGGQAVGVAIPTSLAVPKDTLVTYKCAPTASAGTYTSAQQASFDVLVRNQAVVFLAGPKALTLQGTPATPGAVVTAIKAIEGTQYAVGDLLQVQALDQTVQITCATPGSGPQLSVQASATGGSTLKATSASPTGLYLSAMPQVTGAPVTIAVQCSPTTASNGYSTSDTFSVNITIDDTVPPVVTPAPLLAGLKFTLAVTYAQQPTPAVVAGVISVVQKTAYSFFVAGNVAGIALSDVIVTQAQSRRALSDVSDAAYLQPGALSLSTLAPCAKNLQHAALLSSPPAVHAHPQPHAAHVQHLLGQRGTVRPQLRRRSAGPGGRLPLRRGHRRHLPPLRLHRPRRLHQHLHRLWGAAHAGAHHPRAPRDPHAALHPQLPRHRLRHRVCQGQRHPGRHRGGPGGGGGPGHVMLRRTSY